MSEHLSDQKSSSGTSASVPVGGKLPAAPKNRLGLGIGVLLLLVLVYVVVFELPTWVKPPEKPVIANAVEIAKQNQTPLVESPWQDAQIAKERREAQEILSQLLAKQQQLEEQEVKLWANNQFMAAMAKSEQADVLYRQREFTAAKKLYRTTLAEFEQLISQSEGVYQQALIDGETALKGGNVDQALGNFQLAVAIKPDNVTANKGLQRAQVLTDVLQLIDLAKDAQSNNDYTQAKQELLKAQQLDSASTLVKQELALINKKIVNRNFKNAMSAGYAAISEQDYARAINAFKKALQIKPKAPDAKQALASAENNLLNTKVSALIAKASQHEAKEQWSQANEYFKQALAIDKSLVSAKVGDIRTNARAKLDTKLTTIISQPKRLQSEQVYLETRQLLLQAKKIPQPGVNLRDQITQLELQLVASRKPVNVTFSSDNSTFVTLKRVAKLGTFGEKNIELIPGEYTAIGTRQGYRDVVKQFSLSPKSNDTNIVILCNEKVVN